MGSSVRSSLSSAMVAVPPFLGVPELWFPPPPPHEAINARQMKPTPTRLIFDTSPTARIPGVRQPLITRLYSLECQVLICAPWTFSIRMMEAIDDLLQNLVRLGAEDQVAPAEDVGGNRIDADRGCNAAIFIDHVRVVNLLEGGPEIGGVQPHGGADSHKIVDVLELSAPFPVSLDQRVVDFVESAAFAGDLGRAQRAAGIDDHVAMTQLEPGISRDR